MVIETEKLVDIILKVSQLLCGKTFYPYQDEPARRIIEAVINREGQNITALFARQSGKSELVGAVMSAMAIMLPKLAEELPDDERLNPTDDNGTYRGYKYGVKIGIYAPKKDQASITYNRVLDNFSSDTGEAILEELGLQFTARNGQRTIITNGSIILCQSASEQAKIEGETHHILVLEEAQDIGTMKIQKSLLPMTASTRGLVIRIGTANTVKGDFYTAIKNNRRLEMTTGIRYHFQYDYLVCQRYNSLYRLHIRDMIRQYGVNSDAFRMAYGCEWLLERGMFTTEQVLFKNSVAVRYGNYSRIHERLPKSVLCVAGLDFGKLSDSTVFTVIVPEWDTPLESLSAHTMAELINYETYNRHVVFWKEWIGDDYETQYHEIMYSISCFPGLCRLVLDSTSGEMMCDRFAAALPNVEVEPFNFNIATKHEAYQMLSNDFNAMRITFPYSEEAQETRECRSFCGQMLDLTKDYKQGRMIVQHPDEENAHDDYPDSLCLANWGCREPIGNLSIESTSGNFLL